jgi:hypothetical protein
MPVLDAAGALLAVLILYIIARNIPLRNRPTPSPTAHPEGGIPALSGKTGAIRLWLLVTYTLLVPAFSMALLIAASIDFHPRYTIAAVPGTLLLIAAAGRMLPRPIARAALAAIAIGGLAISAISLNQIAATRAYQHDDFAALAQYYATLPPSAVILVPYNLEPALQVYYAARDDIQARFVNIPLYSDEDAVLAALRDLDDISQIEFLTWYQLPADPRGMYPCLLTGAWDGEPSDLRTFYGLATRSFTRGGFPSGTGPDFLTLDIAPTYDEVSLLAAGYVASDYGVCVRTRWSLNAPLDDLTAAVALFNPLGGLIDRTDATVATDENVDAGDWAPGDTGAAYALLTLPPGAPLADYGLSLTVYTSAQPTGFDVVDAAGNPAGRTLTLPGIITTSGPPFPAGDAPLQPALASSSIDPGGTLETGRPLEVTVLLPRSDLRTVPVTLSGDGWDVTAAIPAVIGPATDWVRLTVPPGNSGAATLTVDGIEVARFTVVDVDRVFEPPAFDTPVDVAFPGVGVLAGVTAPGTGDAIALAAGEPFDVTLVWQAEGATEIPYTVFVQLLTPDGLNLAQSDAGPAGSDRPTTGWVEGEYVVDTHTLQWNVTDYRGPAMLIAGFYDAAGGFQRVNTADGDNSAVIAVEVEVRD